MCNKSAQKSVPLTIQFWYPSGKITLNRGTIDNSVPLWHIPSFSKIRSTHLRRFAPEVTIGSLHYRTYCRIPRCFSTCFFFFYPIIVIRKGNNCTIQAKGIARGLAIRKRLADTKGLPMEWQTGNWIDVQCKAVKESIFTVWLPAYSPMQSRDDP